MEKWIILYISYFGSRPGLGDLVLKPGPIQMPIHSRTDLRGPEQHQGYF